MLYRWGNYCADSTSATGAATTRASGSHFGKPRQQQRAAKGALKSIRAPPPLAFSSSSEFFDSSLQARGREALFKKSREEKAAPIKNTETQRYCSFVWLCSMPADVQNEQASVFDVLCFFSQYHSP